MQAPVVTTSQEYGESSSIVLCWESPNCGNKNPMIGGDVD